MELPQFSLRRLFVMVALMGTGFGVSLGGWRLHNRDLKSFYPFLSHAMQTDVALGIIAIGLFVMGVGLGLPFRRPILIGLAFPLVAWILCFVVLFFWMIYALP